MRKKIATMLTLILVAGTYDDPKKYPNGTADENYYCEIWIPVKRNRMKFKGTLIKSFEHIKATDLFGVPLVFEGCFISDTALL